MARQPVTFGHKVIEVTLTLDTDIYASGDVLADTQVITNSIREFGTVTLQSLTILDKDDQGVAMNVIFLRSNTSIGTENLAFAPSDAVMAEVLAIVEVASGDYVDCVNSQLATLVAGVDTQMGCLLQPTAGDHLYFAVVTGGTPTHTAAGIVMKFGFLRS